MLATRGLRIAYLAGPANAEAIYAEWSAGRAPLGLDISYTRQLFQVCSDLGADVYVITTRSGQYSFSRVGSCVIENRPMAKADGIFYHLVTGYWFIRVLLTLMWYKPDLLIATALQNSWFWLAPIRLTGVMVVPAIHCALWPRFVPQRRRARFLMYLNRVFFYKYAVAILTVSAEISDHVRDFIKKKNVEILTFTPIFHRDHFMLMTQARYAERPPFRVMFSGRMECDKGVYVVADIAERLERSRRGEFKFEMCGDGTELQGLREYIQQRGLNGVVNIHGFCNADELRAVLSQAHAVIVPTTTDFAEGFNKVCAESILAGRPVITSAVCPALVRVREAAIEVPPDDVDAYYRAILQLCDDRDLYEAKCTACNSLQEQFYDSHNSYGAKLLAVLQNHVLPLSR
jgi:glycosyltransferase involved in cell wall biosynthesis